MLGIAATGVIGFLLGKALLVLLLPLIGIATGFLLLVIKIVFWGVMICVGIWILRRWTRREANLA